MQSVTILSLPGSLFHSRSQTPTHNKNRRHVVNSGHRKTDWMMPRCKNRAEKIGLKDATL